MYSYYLGTPYVDYSVIFFEISTSRFDFNGGAPGINLQGNMIYSVLIYQHSCWYNGMYVDHVENFTIYCKF